MEKGNIKWDKAVIGDSARVKSENKMGLIIKDYGRKFHLKFSDGSEKTYDASELDFYRLDEYSHGGKIEKEHLENAQSMLFHYLKEKGSRGNFAKIKKEIELSKKQNLIEKANKISIGTHSKTSDFTDLYYSIVQELDKKYENGGNIEKENNDMLQGQIKEASHHAKELGYIVNDKTVIEPWVVAKMERATTDLSDVTHYLDGQEDKRMKKPVYATGGNLDNVFSSKADDFLYSNIAEKWEHLQEIRSDIKTFLTLSNDLSGEELTFDVANALVLGIIDAVRIIKENGGDELADDISEMFNRAKSEIKE
jgi:hypothetical protein